MTKVAFHTLGCKLNFAETSLISQQFTEQGYERVAFESYADIYVINTCSVTDNADKECKKIVQQLQRRTPEALICITGCYAQLKPDRVASIKGVDLVIGAKEKFKITNYLHDLKKKDFAEIHSCEIEESNTFTSAYSTLERTRAFLKVQDGCDYSCTYCTIPLARGISRSDTLSNVMSNARKIIDQGIKEIVLTGVNIGDYGKGEHGNKKHENTFLELIETLDRLEGLNRIRISSIEPNLLSNEIIDFVAASQKFVPHFHIPLQSGNNKILGLMKRRYRRELYAQKVADIKKKLPHCCIGVDVITGFPGESEDDFLDSYHFLNQLPVSYLHVFTYSERDNTEAAQFNEIVPYAERKKRTNALRILSAKLKENFYRPFAGSIQEVLFEHEIKNNQLFGYSRNYLRIGLHADLRLINEVVKVKLTDLNDEGFFNAVLIE